MKEKFRELDDDLLIRLQKIVGKRMSTAFSIRESHGHDESYHPTSLPAAVVFPQSEDEVVAIVNLCAEKFIPIIPFGTGTSLEGHVAALNGGVCIDLSEMNQIIKFNPEDLDITVQPGVTRKQLNNYIKETGLFFPVDPGADASLGGMAATRASGTNAVRYGTMRENVLSLKVVLPNGKVIKTSGRAKKSAAGYDLTRLFVGSEGTLGVIIEITLKLFGIHDSISSAVASFPTLEDAVNTVIITIQSGIPVARMELLDEVQMNAVNRYSDLDYKLRPTLFFEFHGSKEEVITQAKRVQDIANDFSSSDFQWATKTEDRNKLWQARHDAYYAALALRPGAKGMVTDVCVPISRLAECILETKRDIEEFNLLAPIVGHVGDGNFHLTILVDPDNNDEMMRAKALNNKMILRALDMDGTCTGEHGVGSGKIDFLTAEHGEGVSCMRAIKIAFDPLNIMNPGKVIRV